MNLDRDGNMTVAAVKKYLANKLGLDSEDEVQPPDSEQNSIALNIIRMPFCCSGFGRICKTSGGNI